jgi:epoxyqueuosine reductase QueG
MNEELRNMLLNLGADLVGVADLGALPPTFGGSWSRGLVMAVALDPRIVARLPEGPQAEYTMHYNEINERLDSLGRAAEEWLTARGHQAWAVTRDRAPYDQTACRTPLPHKTIARLAGLGWIGKNALLVTREFGGALRLTTVLTRAPLAADSPREEPGCGDCRKCQEACPGQAIRGLHFQPDLTREDLLDVGLCQAALAARRTAASNPDKIYEGAACGLCLALCPWTKARLARTAA